MSCSSMDSAANPPNRLSKIVSASTEPSLPSISLSMPSLGPPKFMGLSGCRLLRRLLQLLKARMERTFWDRLLRLNVLREGNRLRRGIGRGRTLVEGAIVEPVIQKINVTMLDVLTMLLIAGNTLLSHLLLDTLFVTITLSVTIIHLLDQPPDTLPLLHLANTMNRLK